jgi:hypothetical protein
METTKTKRESIRYFFGGKVIALIAIPLTAFFMELQAQTVSTPKDEFELHAPKLTWAIQRGDTVSFDVLILKSKPYRKSNVKMGLSSALPIALLVQFSPSEGHIEKSSVQIIAGLDTVPGEYHIIISSAIGYRTKGIILTLNVL